MKYEYTAKHSGFLSICIHLPRESQQPWTNMSIQTYSDLTSPPATSPVNPFDSLQPDKLSCPACRQTLTNSDSSYDNQPDSPSSRGVEGIFLSKNICDRVANTPREGTRFGMSCRKPESFLNCGRKCCHSIIVKWNWSIAIRINRRRKSGCDKASSGADKG
jgi:hypothetical protein